MFCSIAIMGLCLPTVTNNTQVVNSFLGDSYRYENLAGDVTISWGGDVVFVDIIARLSPKPILKWSQCKEGTASITCSARFGGPGRGNATITLRSRTRDEIASQWKIISFVGDKGEEPLGPIE